MIRGKTPLLNEKTKRRDIYANRTALRVISHGFIHNVSANLLARVVHPGRGS